MDGEFWVPKHDLLLIGQSLPYNKLMIWARRTIVQLLSLFLFVGLLASAFSIIVTTNLARPAKVENWLAESNLYSHFVDTIIGQSQKSVGSRAPAGSIPLSDSAVKQAAETTFSPSVIQSYVKTFLDSNYAWLEGKTKTPAFTIDLTEKKQVLAASIGQYVQTYFADLPICTAAQLAHFQTTDPLMALCRPPGLTPQAVGANATYQIAHSGSFLSNPIITAASLNPNSSGTGSRPYYQKLSSAPLVYRLATTFGPLIGAISLLLAAMIIRVAPRKRQGLRRIGIVLLSAGLVLIALRYAANSALAKLESKIFNHVSVGQLQQALSDFAGRVEAALVKTDLYVGVGFVVLACLIFGLLIATRRHAREPGAGKSSAVTAPDQPTAGNGPNKNSIDASVFKISRGTTAQGTQTRKSKPPRLIQ